MPSRALVLAPLLAACFDPEFPAEEPVTTTCWVETANRDVPIFGAVTASGVLVRHADGDLLIDGGNSTHFDEEIAVYEGADKLFLETITAQLAPTLPLPHALAAIGGGVDRFLASHIHVDHVGGLIDLPDVPVLMPAAEIEVMQRGLVQTIFEVVPAHAQRIAPLVEPLAFDDGPHMGFAASADLFGDGTVIAVPLPGHTPGSIGIFFSAGAQRVFHVGDAVSTLAQLAQDTGKGFPMSRTDSDPAKTLDTVHVLHRLSIDHPDLKIVPAHDRAAWIAAFGSPGTCR